MRIRNLVAGVLALASSCMFAVAELVPHYAKAYKISVTGGFIEGGFIEEPMTSVSGLYAGDEVGAYIDWSKLYDKNYNPVNAFAKWTYTPATADLGAGFDPFNPEVTVTMPNADVKLTANYVNGFAAYVCAEYETHGEAEPGDFYWSIDNGKTLIPLGEDYLYPVKAGKVTVKFYDKTGNWRAARDDIFTVEKRGTYKEDGVTYYDDPATYWSWSKFVPVNNSTKVKFDVNGGTGPWEEYFANGYEFGELALPYRKGYIFAGWWTEKTGGKHITASTVFDPALFAGQKTPTLYAHWLQLKKLTLKDDSAYAEWSLNEEDFDPELYPEIMHSIFLTNPALENGGYLEGKGVIEVLPGARVTISAESSLWDEKKDIELVFQKWTVTPANSDFGPQFQVSRYSTELTMPSADVTLQATYVDESTCGWVFAEVYANSVNLGWDDETGEDISIDPPFEAFEWSPDSGKTWYKLGYLDDEDVWMYDEGGEYDGGYFYGSRFLLKKGTYTITWRSTDPQWTTTDNGKKITLNPYDEVSVSATFSFIPQVVVDVMTFEDGECALSPVGGTVTMNPKEGLVPVDKTITFTAKANKNYFFQGYALRKYWEYGDEFESTAATWKPDGHYARTYYDPYSDAYYECTQYLFDYNLSNIIDPNDLKVHVVAVFKALSAYSTDDIKFVDWDDYEEEYVEIDSKDLHARTYCSVKYQVECGPMAFPLTYKLGGKLPAGLKFDAKTGVISGVPTKAGDATVTVTATDPAKNSKTLTVNISVKPAAAWMFGDYRGLTYAGPMGYQNQMTSVKPNGLLELSVSATGKGTAKLITRAGTRSASGQLAWEPDEYDPEGEGLYWFETSETKDEEELYVDIYPDGSIEGYADSYLKSEDDWIGGHVYGMRQDKELFAQTGFINQYYTAYLYAPTQNDPGYYDDDDYYYDDYYYYDECSSGTGIGSGFGYLTVKTDAKGGAKIAGKLPDGEAVTLSALVLPIDTESALLYVFSSPSAYKKLGWFAASMILMSDGSIISEQGIFTRPYDSGSGVTEENPAEVYGALYSAAQTLEDYYFTISCQASPDVNLQYTYREDGYIWADYVGAMTFGYYDDTFFNVNLKGDKNGGITLAEKSPAPWNAGGEWNYWEDKNGNPITDPSQLSISFTKATGLFSGKATLYFDYYDGQRQQHKTASLPYSGVVIKNAEEEGLLDGYGAAIYKAARTDLPCYDGAKEKKYTQTVSLPVILVTGCGNCEEIGD